MGRQVVDNRLKPKFKPINPDPFRSKFTPEYKYALCCSSTLLFRDVHNGHSESSSHNYFFCAIRPPTAYPRPICLEDQASRGFQCHKYIHEQVRPEIPTSPLSQSSLPGTQADARGHLGQG
jgi:hypothetical protein